jgi:pantothenate kinase
LFPGQALGGATFLGLARALTSATTFDEALALAAEGEAANVDTLVEDIYGSTGCVDLGLPPSLTAASFGKLSRADLRSTSDADVCRALLEMVAQSCCVLARAHAAQLGCRQRVFFAGGGVGNNQWNAPSSENFKPLYLGRIEVVSADFWTDRVLSATSSETGEQRCRTRTNTCILKSC